MVLKVAAIHVGAVIGAIFHELLEEKPVCRVDLHTVETCLDGIPGCTPEVIDNTRYLIYLQSPGFGIHYASLGVRGYSLVSAGDRHMSIGLNTCFVYTISKF
jgi:hypothetical protein